MITELTKEQIAKFPEYVNKWSKIGLDTKPIDKKAAKIFVKKLYAFLKLEGDPKVIFATGPIDAWNIIEKHYGEKIEFVWPYLDGQFWAGYIAWAAGFITGILGVIPKIGFAYGLETLMSFIVGFAVYLILAELGFEPETVTLG